jgi:hypothetical protein
MYPIYVGVLSAVALFGACAHVGRAKVTEEFRQTVAFDADGEFDISNVNGSIQIATWNRNEVQIIATKSASSEAALKQVQIEITGSGDRVEVDTKLPRG